MEQRIPSPSLSWFLLVALFLHVLLTQIQNAKLLEIPSLSSIKKVLAPVEVETVPRLSVVQTSKALNQDENVEAKPNYGAEFRNRVEEETQAIRRGRFEERIKGGEALTELTTPDGEIQKGQALSLSDLSVSPASPNFLKGVKEGSQTILNTDKVLYASFLNRIADEIYDVWVRHCQEAIKQVYGRGNKMSPNTFITKLGIVMNGNGKVISLQIVESSGIQELDDAPKQAFWETEPFPNPPKQLVEDDGFVHLNYEFHFQWNSSAFIVPLNI